MAKCVLCNHSRDQHKDNSGQCAQVISVKYKSDKTISRVVLCTCPEMVYRVKWKWVLMLDWMLDKRLRRYIGETNKTLEMSAPSKSEVVRRALDEWLKGKGY